MNDQHHAGGVRLQSTAIVAAALITTLGAVTAACIQTGWFGKPVAISLAPLSNSPPITNPTTDSAEADPQPAVSFAQPVAPFPETSVANASAFRVAPAKFTGKIEPANDPARIVVPSTMARLVSSAPPRAVATTPVASSQIVPVPQNNFAYYPPNAESQTSAVQPSAIEPAAQFAPVVLPQPATESAPKVINSPWSYLGQTPPDANAASAAKPAKKTVDWSLLTRWFQGHN